MIEILWHGRGGQGAFTAARLLGAAASLDDAAYALAFPSFGPERRGAPMRAFTKISAAPIGDRSAIKKADYVVYLDDTLFGGAWEDELKPDGRVLVNTQKTAEELADGRPDEALRIIAIDANRISSEILGRPIPNTVFLGALAAFGVLDIAQVKRAIAGYMDKRLHDANKRIVDAAFAEVTAAIAGGAAVGATNAGANAAEAGGADVAAEVAAVEVGGAGVANAGAAGVAAEAGGAGVANAGAADSAEVAADAAALAAALTAHPLSEREAQHIPTLRNDELDPAEFARSTCFTAGHLVDKNAGWRNIRPVVDEGKCTGCLQCYMYCPDGAIFKVTPKQGKRPVGVAIDYDFCKGCGMCVRACKFGAISMIGEPEALIAEAAVASATEADSVQQHANESEVQA